MDNSALLMRGTRKPSPSFFFLLSVSLFFFLNFLGYVIYIPGFPRGAVVKNMPANAGGTGNMGSVPGSGKSPGEGNGNPLQVQSMESQRVGHNLSELITHMYTKNIWFGPSLVVQW